MNAALRLVRSPVADYEVSTEKRKQEILRSVSPKARALYNRGISNVKMINQGEINLLKDLRETDDLRSFTEFKSQSLYAYAVDWLGLTSNVALNLIAVMRRAKQVPELVEAIKDGRINVSAARKITPVINPANKDAWLELASTHSVAKIEKAVATASPKHAVQETIRYVTAERLEMRLGISEEFRDTLKELKDVFSQKSQKAVDSEEAMLQAMREALVKHSSLEKAKRARLRREKKNVSAKVASDKASLVNLTAGEIAPTSHEKRDEKSSKATATESALPVKEPIIQKSPANLGVFKRSHLSAATKHFVHLRDGNQCTELDLNGQRCNQRRWLDIHHIVEVAKGGDNSPENLRTVCGHHHSQLHKTTAYVSRHTIKRMREV